MGIWGDWGVYSNTGGSSQCGMEVEGERRGKQSRGWRVEAGAWERLLGVNNSTEQWQQTA